MEWGWMPPVVVVILMILTCGLMRAAASSGLFSGLRQSLLCFLVFSPILRRNKENSTFCAMLTAYFSVKFSWYWSKNMVCNWGNVCVVNNEPSCRSCKFCFNNGWILDIHLVALCVLFLFHCFLCSNVLFCVVSFFFLYCASIYFNKFKRNQITLNEKWINNPSNFSFCSHFNISSFCWYIFQWMFTGDSSFSDIDWPAYGAFCHHTHPMSVFN